VSGGCLRLQLHNCVLSRIRVLASYLSYAMQLDTSGRAAYHVTNAETKTAQIYQPHVVRQIGEYDRPMVVKVTTLVQTEVCTRLFRYQEKVPIEREKFSFLNPCKSHGNCILQLSEMEKSP
jgi:hypothetical protein